MNNIKFLASFFILITLLFPNLGRAMDEDALKVIPRSYPLFTVEYSEEAPPIPTYCSVSDFEKSCGYNKTCTTRKGICGENLSEYFFQNDAEWEKLEGKYDSNRGFDGFYKVNDYNVKFIIVEDKAGELAHLNTKTRQMSIFWQKKQLKHYIIHIKSTIIIT